MKDSIYDYSNYKDYLNDLIDSKGKHKRGLRRALAAALNCQSPFISQVLSGNLDFSSDQALACADFFGLSKDETEFMLLLTSKAKASTAKLKKFLQNEIDSKKISYRLINNRMKMKGEVDKEHQAEYYSSWIYSAVHMALTIPELQSRIDLAKRFGFKLEIIDQVLAFLQQAGLVEKKGTHFFTTGKWYHLEKNSLLMRKHHTNIHLKSLQSLDQPSAEDLHYSAIFSCSKTDLPLLEEKILQLLSEFNAIVRPSKEEELAAITLNFFRL